MRTNKLLQLPITALRLSGAESRPLVWRSVHCGQCAAVDIIILSIAVS